MLGTITADEIRTDEVQGATSETSITIGSALFPSTDSVARSTASFGGSASFVKKSAHQAVVSASATVDPSTTIVGVRFNGSVQLEFVETPSTPTEVFVVDEGGFCSSTNLITATLPTSAVPLVLASPYAYLSVPTIPGSVAL
ncbi:EsV-1-123 [Ectocarpus siliculosus]|uniref:EsV-1-123 n=1 Tax=Ectocarpus siliculosus TaxID=2880 RepID=D8LPE9_ECTSI|nr:EsV-1-123 [Ectocarpus siliculosus]|eukprot:CBN80421.1 EsV-1-123 [Ectocarpus siliculosus]